MPLLDEKSIIPLYHQLIEELRQKIESEEYPPQSLFPSETELHKTYGVSRGTIRQALTLLVQEGLLYRKQGKGTFVADPKSIQQLNIFHSFAQDMKSKGSRPFSKIIQNEKITPNPSVRKFLKLEKWEMVYKLRALKVSNKSPFTLETTYLAEKFFPDLDALDKEQIVKVPLYDILIEKYNVHITSVQETFELCFLDEFESKYLKLPVDSVALLVNRKTFTGENVPFEFRRILVRSDCCKYQVKFTYGTGVLDLQL